MAFCLWVLSFQEGYFLNHQQNSPKVVVSDPAPSGIKSKVSMFPGVMVLHRLLKNFRYWSDSSRGTVGGIRRAQMTVDEGAQYTESIFRKIDQVLTADENDPTPAGQNSPTSLSQILS